MKGKMMQKEQPEALQLPTLPFAVFDEFGQPCEDRVRDHFAAAFEALRAQIGQGVPDGWQLVPKTSIPEIAQAIVNATGDGYGAAYRAGKAWSTALASAPPAPQASAPRPAFAFRECEDSQAGIAPQASVVAFCTYPKCQTTGMKCAGQCSQAAVVQQEPIYQYQLADGAWVDQIEESYRSNKANGAKNIRIVYTHPAQQQKPLTDEQITAGARALCKRSSEICGVNADDNWNLESEYFKDDARCVLEAAHNIGDKK